MTESLWVDTIDPEGLFHDGAPRPLRVVALGHDGHAALGARQCRVGACPVGR